MTLTRSLQAGAKRVDDALAQLFKVLQLALECDRIVAYRSEHQHLVPPQIYAPHTLMWALFLAN